MRAWVVGAAAALGLVGGAGGAAPAPGELVFASTRAPDLHDEVYVLDTSTGARRNVSKSPTADGYAALSPDRRTIAFVSDRGGGEAVWVTPASGGPLRRLHAPLAGRIDAVEWSPDGRRLAFQLDPPGRFGDVYVVDRDGGNARRIARMALNATWLTSSTLAVDESSRVTVRRVDGRLLWRRAGFIGDASARGELALFTNGRIQVVGASGRLRSSFRGFAPLIWSPDGSRLAYSLTFDGTGIGVIDGAGRRVVLGRGYALMHGWSPDGRTLLAYQSQPFRPVRVSLAGKATPVPLENGLWSRTGAALIGIDSRGRLAVWRPGSTPRPLRPPPARESCPPRIGSIAWLDDRRVVLEMGRDGKFDADLWTADRAGNQLRRVRRSPLWEAAPEWSPDGTRVVYESGDVHTHADQCTGPMTPHLRTAAANGSGDRALTPHDDGHFQHGPRWSPDGTKVAFHRTDISDLDEFGVFVVDVATRTLQRLTTGYGQGVSWSPDGKRVAFSGRGVSVADLGSGTVTSIGPGERAEWSPDGSLIAHVRGGDVWVMSPDGTAARRLVDATVVGDLRWSPDGSMLAFGVRDGIRIVRRDGRVVRTIGPRGAQFPRFSRDGRLVAFVAAPGPPIGASSSWSELYVADVAGGPARRVTRDYAGVGAPNWR